MLWIFVIVCWIGKLCEAFSFTCHPIKAFFGGGISTPVGTRWCQEPKCVLQQVKHMFTLLSYLSIPERQCIILLFFNFYLFLKFYFGFWLIATWYCWDSSFWPFVCRSLLTVLVAVTGGDGQDDNDGTMYCRVIKPGCSRCKASSIVIAEFSPLSPWIFIVWKIRCKIQPLKVSFIVDSLRSWSPSMSRSLLLPVQAITCPVP